MGSGLLFQQRRCKICNRFLDEVSKQKSKKKAYDDEDSDDNLDNPFIDPFTDQLTLYECGHAYHIKCVERYI